MLLSLLSRGITMNILDLINDPSNMGLQIFLVALAGFRVYLEIIKFDFQSLPMTKTLMSNPERSAKFHKVGLYLSIGFILTMAPNIMASF
jgi:hypothetical protein